MIRNLLFDMGGVVFLQDTAEAFRRFREAGIDPDIYMGDYGQKEFFLDVETGAITADEFCRHMAEATGQSGMSFEAAQHCWLGFVKEIPEDRLALLERLRQQYHVCLLSNTNPFIMSYMRSEAFSKHRFGIGHYFDNLFLSYEMHVCKPDERIFLTALGADGMKASETIFVDDSAANANAAASLGIHALHVATNADWSKPLMAMLSELNR